MLAMVKLRMLETDDDFSLRGKTLARAIEEDRNLGLVPFFVSQSQSQCILVQNSHESRQILGPSLVCSLVRSHCSLIRWLRHARLARALLYAQLAHLLSHF